MSFEQLQDFDYFFYYGELGLQEEIRSDLYQLVMQPGRSLFYNRGNDSAGLDQYEGSPNAIVQMILIPYNIVNAISRRNTYVGDGQNNTRDRRVVASQNTVKIMNSENQVDVSVFYIPLFNINNGQQITTRLIG